jgi:hypothetical protein
MHMRILAVIGAFVLLSTPVNAQPGRGSTETPGGRTGNTDNAGGTVAGQPTAQTFVASCTEPSAANTATHPPISITINPATRWQPRGGEVLVSISADASLFRSFTVRACFGWSTAEAENYFSSPNLRDTFKNTAFVQVRPNQRSEVLDIGVTVPNLRLAPSSIFDRWGTATRFTGMGVIPVADMRLIGYNDSGMVFDVVRPVGITSVSFSVLLSLSILTVALAVLYRFAVGMPQPAAARDGLRGIIKRIFSFRWMLSLIRNADGRASLSAFQVLLWTVVVALSAVYVMTLSGNLIDVTPGALTLLGIAGAASLIASAQKPSDALAPAPLTDPPLGVPVALPAGLVEPSWVDLVRQPEGTLPDVTRLQMLFFTVVSAGFVVMQVLTSYVIPDIPTGYQILMGISNGVYVGGKFANR